MSSITAVDAIFNPSVPRNVKQTLIEIIEDKNITDQNIMIITPTPENDDMNGSQHHPTGGNNFTYKDATTYDLQEATGFGYYEYFSGSLGYYTGHYYHGDNHFPAIVVNPPAYAQTHPV